MNERIRELAREAAGGLLSYNAEGEFYLSEKEAEKFAELIIAAEHEAIAKMFDGNVWAYDYREIAAAIRARDAAKLERFEKAQKA
jgi:hypothetical protein